MWQADVVAAAAVAKKLESLPGRKRKAESEGKSEDLAFASACALWTIGGR